MKEVWVVVELHKDCPKIRAICTTKEKANAIAYQRKDFWCNVFKMELDKVN